VTYRPGAVPRRVLERDPSGQVTAAVERRPDGAFEAGWARCLDGTWVGVLPGGAEHPPWGPSDRIVGGRERPELLTVSTALDWDRIDAIPALADPARLPPGAGSAILNLLAGLAADQGAAALRYRGPYATEQLFWSLLESFRVDDPADGLARFLAGAEAAFLGATMREAPVDWRPAPHERRLLPDGAGVQLRDGVEKVWWDGRAYYRPEWQGLGRDEHRVVRAVVVEGRVTFVAGLVALGRPVEDHLVLDADGRVLDRPAPAGPTGPDAEAPLDSRWAEALAALVPLQATALLRPAIRAVWPAFRLAWGPVTRDLVAARGERLRLSWALARLYRAGAAGRDGAARRALGRDLVRTVLGLVGPPLRQAAAAWLADQPAVRRSELLGPARPPDSDTVALEAAAALGRLLDALAAGEALPVLLP
jgi:hypothetical protein